MKFRFYPELFDCKSQALEALTDAGFQWFSDFRSVDTDHDLHGIEVWGIQSRETVRGISQALLKAFPTWRVHHLEYNEFHPGWLLAVTVPFPSAQSSVKPTRKEHKHGN